MMSALLLGEAVALTGLVTASVARPVLVRLPEPPDAADKIAYRQLATWRFVTACGLASAAAAAVGWLAAPAHLQPQWTVLATVGVLLAAIDLRTTWLPLRLTRVGWTLMALATVVSVALGAHLDFVVRSAVGALAAGSLYGVVWAVSRGGFGFGDVRFAPLIGAATAGQSWTLLLWGLTLGSVVGAVHGLARLVLRRGGSFPYAPSMLAGGYLAAAAARTLSG